MVCVFIIYPFCYVNITIGLQKGQSWKASSYLAVKSNGIYHDVDKLTKIARGDKFVLILATKNPEYEKDGEGDWSISSRVLTVPPIGSIFNIT